MLTVVHEKEQLSVPQDLGQRVVELLGGTLRHPEGLGYLLGYESPFGERGQLHQPHPVRVHPDEVAGRLQGQPRLARAARAGERQEAGRGQPSLDLGHLALPAHEAAPRGRQVVPRGLVCSAGAQNTQFGRSSASWEVGGLAFLLRLRADPGARTPIPRHCNNRAVALSALRGSRGTSSARWCDGESQAELIREGVRRLLREGVSRRFHSMGKGEWRGGSRPGGTPTPCATRRLAVDKDQQGGSFTVLPADA